jgi:putative serine protease PepD
MRLTERLGRVWPGTALALAGLAISGCGGSSSSSDVTARPVSKTAIRSAQADLERRFVAVIHDVSPAVVQIQTPDGLGSGVVYDARGDIVTNNHVVGAHKAFTVTLAAGNPHRATLVGVYPPEDLAVIRLASGSPRIASFGDSNKVQVGEFALAIGNPLGLRSSVTQGIVSSLGRTVGEGGGVVISSAIQTSAPINPGNSGGALVDLAGDVIGIPTLAATNPELGGAQAPGIGFAIPSNTVKRIASQLIAHGRVTRSGRAILGVEVATRLSPPAVVVAGVKPGGPADRAGIRRGDVITSVNGVPTRTSDDLVTILAKFHPGQRVRVALLRPDGARAKVEVRLGEG